MAEPKDSMLPVSAEEAERPPQARRLTLQQGLELALRHHGSGDLPRADRLYRKILEADPEHPTALQMLGVIAHQTGKHALAAELIAHSLVRKPDDAGAHCNLGLALQALGRHEEAAAHYREAVELEPAHADALFNLGNALAELAHFHEAAESFRRVVALRPNSASAHGNLATMLAELGRLEDAAASYRKALALRPDDAEAHSNLGTTLAGLGSLEAAAASYRKALALKPGFADAWFNLHTTLYAAGDVEPAAHCLEEALRAAPGHLMSRFFLGVLRDHQGHAELAARHFAALPEDGDLVAYALDSWRYVKSAAGPQPRLHGETSEGLALGLEAARLDGLVLEFGVRFGTTLRQIAAGAGQEVHGFDTFQGLPEAWHDVPAGAYSTEGELPEVPPNVRLHVGPFAETLPGFLESHRGAVRFMHVDCRLYSSAMAVLELLAPRIVPGTVIVFAEYLFNRRWREDEFKALEEAAGKFGWRYDYLAVSLAAKQAVVIMR